MKLGIYISEPSNRRIDCRNILEMGNPGMGGTVYEFAMLASYIGQNPPLFPGVELTVFQSGRYALTDNVNSVEVGGWSNLKTMAIEHGIDVLILDSRLPLSFIKSFKDSGIKLILWAHCIGAYYRYLFYARWKAVKRVVFVSRGHYLNYLDYSVIRKASYAFNAVSVSPKIHALRESSPFRSRPHDVVFMGALDQSKGFHLLAKVWPKVLEKVPDARLHVIGSANLYGGNFKIGPLGIAAEDYEAAFSRYLTTEEGKLHPSVILHGQLADQKYEVMAGCRVGVPNPDGRTETFCICAVEMQLCGCKVVTKWSSGYLDTVPSPNVLVDREEDLANAITQALMDDSFSWSSNIKNIDDNFSIESVGKKWQTIIQSVQAGEHFSENFVIPQKFKLRLYNGRLRRAIPILPPLGFIGATLSRTWEYLRSKLRN